MSYTDDQICNMLKNVFKLDTTKKDIQECKPDFVQKIYTFLIRDFGAAYEKLNQLPFTAPATILQYSEMYKSASFLIGLTKTIQFYLTLIYKETDFNLSDVRKPEYQRTKRFFSQFLEFYDHICKTLDKYDSVENEAQMETERLEKLQETIICLKEELNKRKIENAECEFHHQKEMEQFMLIKKEMEKVQELKIEYKARLEELKEEIKSIELKNKEIELNTLQDKKEIENLEKLIVKDGEVSHIEEIKHKLTSIMDSNEELKIKLKQSKEFLQNIIKAEKLITESLLPALHDIDQECSKKEETECAIKVNTKAISDLLEKIQDLTHHHSQHFEETQLLQERHSQLQKSWELRKTGLLQEIKQLQLNKDELLNSNEKIYVEENECLAEIEHLRNEIDIIKDGLLEVTNFIQNYLQEAMKAIQEYVSLEHNFDIDNI